MRANILILPDKTLVDGEDLHLEIIPDKLEVKLPSGKIVGLYELVEKYEGENQ